MRAPQVAQVHRSLVALLVPVLLGHAGVVVAQPVPATVNYQGRLTDNTPQQSPVDGTLAMRFAIYDAQVGGSCLWKEPSSGGVDVEVVKGIFTHVLGSSEPLPPGVFGGFTSVRYLEVTIRPDDPGEETLAPRQVLTSTPYAARAGSATSADSAGDAFALGGVSATNYLRSDFTYLDPAWISSLSGSKVSGIVGNANLLDGLNSTAFALVAHAHGGADITSGSVDEARLDGSWTTKGFAATTLTATSAAASSLTVAGGIVAGSGTVGIVNGAGKVPAVTSTYFASLDGSALTNVGAASIGRPGFSRSSFDTAVDSGQYTSIIVGADGLGLVSYHDATNLDLKVAHCSNVGCTSATIATLDAGGDVGKHSSITIGADGLGLVSYYDATNGNLKVAHCTNAACSASTTVTVDAAGDVGQFTSITVGIDGLPLVSYYDATNGDLEVAHCSDATCGAATFATLDTTGGQYTSITIDGNGLGVVSYSDNGTSDLSLARCTDVVCSSGSTKVLDPAGGLFTSIGIGSDGLPIVGYILGNYANVAHCDSIVCDTASSHVIGYLNGGQAQTALTIGPDGKALVAFATPAPHILLVAHCSDAICSERTVASIDGTPDAAGRHASMTMGSDGLGLVSYYDETGGDLKVAHLSNPLGPRWVRRR